MNILREFNPLLTTNFYIYNMPIIVYTVIAFFKSIAISYLKE